MAAKLRDAFETRLVAFGHRIAATAERVQSTTPTTGMASSSCFVSPQRGTWRPPDAWIASPMLGTFACARYRFVAEAITPVHLSAFAGATLRGGFGHVFKRTVCTWPPADCPRRELKNTCAYPCIFETRCAP